MSIFLHIQNDGILQPCRVFWLGGFFDGHFNGKTSSPFNCESPRLGRVIFFLNGSFRSTKNGRFERNLAVLVNDQTESDIEHHMSQVSQSDLLTLLCS